MARPCSWLVLIVLLRRFGYVADKPPAGHCGGGLGLIRHAGRVAVLEKGSGVAYPEACLETGVVKRASWRINGLAGD